VKESKYIPCECGSEGLLIDHYDDSYNISMLHTSHEQFKMGWINRVKHACRVLFTGKIYHDQMIISHDSAKMLVNFFLRTGTNTETVKSYTVDELYIDGQETNSEPII
jgi:hypothetical protein